MLAALQSQVQHPESQCRADAPPTGQVVQPFEEWRKSGRMVRVSRGEGAIWYSVCVACREFPEVGDFEWLFQRSTAEGNLCWLLRQCACGGHNAPLKKRFLALADAREGEGGLQRNRARPAAEAAPVRWRERFEGTLSIG